MDQIISGEGTVCFPVDRAEQRILLGLKKRGAGVGRYNGFGGKIECGESPVVAAARELWEESSLTTSTTQLLPMGHVYFPYVQQRMHIFVVDKWAGLPRESDEMIPQWFPLAALPHDQMWPTDRDWLPHVLAGRCIAAVVHKDASGQRSSVVTVIDTLRVQP